MQRQQRDWDQLRVFVSSRTEAVVSLATHICSVPAPTDHEGERAELVASLLRKRGYAPEIDATGNVYTRRGGKGRGPVLMLIAHMDTVFPPGTPIVIQRDGHLLHGPGIWDNSLGVAALITTLDMLDAFSIETDTDVLAVAVVGEEGLGNLRGTRAAVERYKQDLGAVIVIDGQLGHIITGAVGSKRWRISVHGPGGHSFGSFGQPSAIHGLGKIIAAIADLSVPHEPKTTYNVGIISGGTSVNTIAASAKALLDMRSTDAASLAGLATQVQDIIEHSAGAGLRTEIEVVGERPAGQRDPADPLIQLAAQTLTWLGRTPAFHTASTDANIPISLNIPCVCIGVTKGERAHTLEEFLHISPIGDGLAQIVRLTIEASSLLVEK